MTEEQRLIAEHLAKKGATFVAPGVGVGFTDRQWYAASQGRIDLNEKLAKRDEERAAERVRERFAEARYYGASQDLAHRYATGQIDCLCCGDLPNGAACEK
jgi:hypothetical protein